MSRVTFLILGLFTVLSCGSQLNINQGDKPDIPFKSFDSKSKGFSIQIPANWKMKNNSHNLFVESKAKHQSESYKPSINILKSPGKYPEQDMIMFMFALKMNAKTGHKYKIIKTEDAKLLNGDAIKVTIYEQKKKPALKTIQYYTYSKKSAYIITFRANKKTFSKYKKLFDYVISTFKMH